jgi:hypothetical protein
MLTGLVLIQTALQRGAVLLGDMWLLPPVFAMVLMTRRTPSQQ